MENVRNIEDQTFNNRKKRSYFVPKSNCQSVKFFTENLSAIEMKKTHYKTLINKFVYLGLSILELTKTVIYML